MRLARAALADYPVEVRRLRLVSDHLNVVFRAETADGRVLAVRAGRPGWRTEADLRVEAAWLQALAADSDIGAPAVVPTRWGEAFTSAGAAGIPERHLCLVTSWIPGRRLRRPLPAAAPRRLGELSARLHAHAATWRVPRGLQPVRADRVLARGEPGVRFGGVLEAAAERVAAEAAALWAGPAPPRAIHNDLNQDNVLVDGDRLRPLDFEDVGLGYPVQDIAMTFHDLLCYAGLDPEGYARAKAAFADGYTRLAPWPEQHPGQVDAFIAGRLLWRANYSARLEGDRGFLHRVAECLRVYLRTGALLRP